ncbi:MAG: GNAT family N-acetyltransferase [Christensenellaceae bacterium]|jgi:ribosomal-protein-alanine N-acetyltransferase
MNEIVAMNKQYAKKIATWKYEGVYDVYSFEDDAEAMRELLNGDYYVSVTPDGEIHGFYCFGTSAQIPTKEDKVYRHTALDFGLGMRPDLCGKGLGRRFVREGIAFAERKFHAKQIRLSVASFNQRAIRTYESEGFQRIKSMTHAKSNNTFYMMVCVLT